MRLIHWTSPDRPLITVEPRRQSNDLNERRGHYKPAGLWVSDEDSDDSWSKWCHAEDFSIGNLQLGYEITLAAETNLLWISETPRLDAFTDEFQFDPYGGRLGDIDWPRPQWVDWVAVARRYGGVIITPYLWSRRLEYLWYYGWDCASGVIWDDRNVASFELVDTLKT